MAKPEMGTKRQCMSCAVRFYDLMKTKIACPSCGTSHDPEAASRSRKTRRPVEKSTEAPSPLSE